MLCIQASKRMVDFRNSPVSIPVPNFEGRCSDEAQLLKMQLRVWFMHLLILHHHAGFETATFSRIVVRKSYKRQAGRKGIYEAENFLPILEAFESIKTAMPIHWHPYQSF